MTMRATISHSQRRCAERCGGRTLCMGRRNGGRSGSITQVSMHQNTLLPHMLTLQVFVWFAECIATVSTILTIPSYKQKDTLACAKGVFVIAAGRCGLQQRVEGFGTGQIASHDLDVWRKTSHFRATHQGPNPNDPAGHLRESLLPTLPVAPAMRMRCIGVS
jgi:hypothetical protein